MRAFVSRLAIGLLLTHATFGCGWRHAHAELPQIDAQIESSAHDCCDSHGQTPCTPTQHGDPTQHGPTKHCPCHIECQVRCNYVPSERVQLDDQQQFSVPLDGAVLASITTDDLSAQQVVFLSDGPPQPDSLRRHLVFQLLLI